jgi:predicted lipid-binding transport protein (Tim44 family)
MVGSMLFGGLAHGMGQGGLFGSGIGLIEILLIGGVLYFLYTRFLRPKRATAHNYGSTPSSSPFPAAPGSNAPEAAGAPPFPGATPPPGDPISGGLDLIRSYDPGFTPEAFKDLAQDIFFNVQAGWTRRDIGTIEGLLGPELRDEYARHFQGQLERGEANRLENIAVRKVEIVDAGIDAGEDHITVLFTANLLDYTVEDSSGRIIDGSATEPVRFAERWTFARPSGHGDWILVGVHGAS